MAEPGIVSLGPFQGINNIDAATGGVFQLQTEQGQPAPFLLEAVNVDLDRMGWLRRRTGQTKRISLNNAHSLAVVGGQLVVVENGWLFTISVNSWTITSVGGMCGNDETRFLEAGGEIYWVSPSSVGRYPDRNWGLSHVTTPEVVASSGGSLLAGRYLVVLTSEDASGLESGYGQPSVVEVDNGDKIVLSNFSYDAWTASLNVYVSDANGTVPFLVANVPPSNSITISQVDVTTDPAFGQGLFPPPFGQQLGLFRGRILVASGNVLYWSQPLGYHHFAYGTDVQLFDSRIVMLGCLDEGFYVAVESGKTFWIQGDDPENWQPKLVDVGMVAEGEPLKMPGRNLAPLNYDGLVLVWATQSGFMVGLPTGQLVPLTVNKVAMDANKKATLVYRESPGLQQILLGLREKGLSTQLGSSDRVSCTVIKAGQDE